MSANTIGATGSLSIGGGQPPNSYVWISSKNQPSPSPFNNNQNQSHTNMQHPVPHYHQQQCHHSIGGGFSPMNLEQQNPSASFNNNQIVYQQRIPPTSPPPPYVQQQSYPQQSIIQPHFPPQQSYPGHPITFAPTIRPVSPFQVISPYSQPNSVVPLYHPSQQRQQVSIHNGGVDNGHIGIGGPGGYVQSAAVGYVQQRPQQQLYAYQSQQHHQIYPASYYHQPPLQICPGGGKGGAVILSEQNQQVKNQPQSGQVGNQQQPSLSPSSATSGIVAANCDKSNNPPDVGSKTSLKVVKQEILSNDFHTTMEVSPPNSVYPPVQSSISTTPPPLNSDCLTSRQRPPSPPSHSSVNKMEDGTTDQTYSCPTIIATVSTNDSAVGEAPSSSDTGKPIIPTIQLEHHEEHSQARPGSSSCLQRANTPADGYQETEKAADEPGFGGGQVVVELTEGDQEIEQQQESENIGLGENEGQKDISMKSARNSAVSDKPSKTLSDNGLQIEDGSPQKKRPLLKRNGFLHTIRDEISNISPIPPSESTRIDEIDSFVFPDCSSSSRTQKTKTAIADDLNIVTGDKVKKQSPDELNGSTGKVAVVSLQADQRETSQATISTCAANKNTVKIGVESSLSSSKPPPVNPVVKPETGEGRYIVCQICQQLAPNPPKWTKPPELIALFQHGEIHGKHMRKPAREVLINCFPQVAQFEFQNLAKASNGARSTADFNEPIESQSYKKETKHSNIDNASTLSSALSVNPKKTKSTGSSRQSKRSSAECGSTEKKNRRLSGDENNNNSAIKSEDSVVASGQSQTTERPKLSSDSKITDANLPDHKVILPSETDVKSAERPSLVKISAHVEERPKVSVTAKSNNNGGDRTNLMPPRTPLANDYRFVLSTTIKKYKDEGKPLICALCDQILRKSRTALEVHLLSSHVRNVTYRCQICAENLTADSYPSMKNHQKMHQRHDKAAQNMTEAEMFLPLINLVADDLMKKLNSACLLNNVPNNNIQPEMTESSGSPTLVTSSTSSSNQSPIQWSSGIGKAAILLNSKKTTVLTCKLCSFRKDNVVHLARAIYDHVSHHFINVPPCVKQCSGCLQTFSNVKESVSHICSKEDEVQNRTMNDVYYLNDTFRQHLMAVFPSVAKTPALIKLSNDQLIKYTITKR